MKKLVFATAILLCGLMSSTFAQIVVSGIITDVNKNAIVGASIQLEPTMYATTSDASGKFYLNKIRPGTYTVKVFRLGYKSYEAVIEILQAYEIQIVLQPVLYINNEITVTALRKGNSDMMTSVTINKEEIEERNTGVDIPFLLEQTPSVIATSDAGTGIGYTGLRIRGTDATRINVTLNGVPLNDAESQQLYWVDLPDVASSMQNIQVQRGVGTSTNGGSAFGGSVNMLLQRETEKPYSTVQLASGSFNTFKRNISFGTGLIKNHFYFNGRLSKINSDGYVDRSSADLQSYMLQTGYAGQRFSIHVMMMDGKEKTYQAWNGIPESRWNNDTQSMLAYINRNGLDSTEAFNLLNSGTTYNYFDYKNQTDNYRQTHYQLQTVFDINAKNLLQVSLHYTKGRGYYEEYKKQQTLADYSITNTVYDGDTILESDIIRQKWLDNDFYGFIFSISSQVNTKLELINGGGYNIYDGKHFGDVIWYQFVNPKLDHVRYYSDNAIKHDYHYFLKAIYTYNKWKALIDLQYRGVKYSFEGKNELLMLSQQKTNLHFFNPKAGLSYAPNQRETGFVSVSVGNKEPSRDDYVNSSPLTRPKHESLIDIESGYTYTKSKWMAKANYFLMLYKNQLALSGKINDVGEYTRVNIANSFREGIEIEMMYKPFRKVTLNGNITLSRNKIKQFDEFVDNYDDGSQNQITHNNVDVSFSPATTGFVSCMYSVTSFLKLNYEIKYVGKQHLDNTQNEAKMLPQYLVNGASVILEKEFKSIGVIQLNVRINNLLDKKYVSNGYTYGYIYGNERITENFYFPQAGRNFVMQFVWKMN
nr:TonB-dependent receptor [Bacteroidota bacterium]